MKKTKEVVFLTQKLKTKQSAENLTTPGTESDQVVEEAVETAGDFKTCEC